MFSAFAFFYERGVYGYTLVGQDMGQMELSHMLDF